MGKLYDRVKVATTTTGTGTITLGAPERSVANGDFLSFAEAGVPTGTLVSYWIQDGAAWASGEGVYTAAGNTLTRDANEVRWNGSALAAGKLELSGNAKVYISPRAVDLVSGWTQIGSPLSTASGNVWTIDPLPTEYTDLYFQMSGITRSAGADSFAIEAKFFDNWTGLAQQYIPSGPVFRYFWFVNLLSQSPLGLTNMTTSESGIEAYPRNISTAVRFRWMSNAPGNAGTITMYGR